MEDEDGGRPRTTPDTRLRARHVGDPVAVGRPAQAGEDPPGLPDDGHGSLPARLGHPDLLAIGRDEAEALPGRRPGELRRLEREQETHPVRRVDQGVADDEPSVRGEIRPAGSAPGHRTRIPQAEPSHVHAGIGARFRWGRDLEGDDLEPSDLRGLGAGPGPYRVGPGDHLRTTGQARRDRLSGHPSRSFTGCELGTVRRWGRGGRRARGRRVRRGRRGRAEEHPHRGALVPSAELEDGTRPHRPRGRCDPQPLLGLAVTEGRVPLPARDVPPCRSGGGHDGHDEEPDLGDPPDPLAIHDPSSLVGAIAGASVPWGR